MSVNEHITISKKNILPEGQDYDLLRAEGIKLIEQIGSKLWTDYNIHDPGITILETICYAITDLSYRASFDVKDLLAVQPPAVFNADEQAFFTAREILTTAPWTVNDYRKLLIDLDGVKNAWIKCSLCNCGPQIYVDCAKSELSYKKPLPPENVKEHEVVPKGLYDVLLEFDDDGKNGDLNSGKVTLSYNLLINSLPETLHFEVRFPSLHGFEKLEKANAAFKFFRDPQTRLNAVLVQVISNKKLAVADIDDALLVSALRGGMYVTMQMSIDEFVTDPNSATTHVVKFTDVPFRLVWLNDDVRGVLTVADLRDILTENSVSGIAAHYLQKIQASDNVLKIATSALQTHRNITEDFCCIDEAEIEEIGVCTDMELKPDADIEQVLAQVYYLIGEYFNPSIRFYTLSQMLETKTVDQVFDGPKLLHGFIDEKDLEISVLNRTLYSSDIINLLMDIPEIIAIKNFVLVRFDEEGNRKETDPWKLELSLNKLPRLYLEGSKIMVFKNDLPFLPDTFELMDTMQVIYGNNMMPKLKDHDLDLAIPKGQYYDMADYYPIQNSLPLVYGTGYEGLPSNASELRKAQAKQLKAYLLFFEQMLVNYLGKLSNLKQLFSINNTVSKTAFPVLLNEDSVKGVTELYDNLDELSLYAITESKAEFLTKRNAFLDHVMARFSESFSDYALLLYSYKEQSSITAEKLIQIKTSFLKQFPYQSAYKAQGFDHTDKTNITIKKDLSGLHNRISALLGLQPSLNFFKYNIVQTGELFSSVLTLNNEAGQVLLNCINTLSATKDFSGDDRDILVKDINFNIAAILKVIGDKTNFSIVADGAMFKIGLGSPLLAASTGYASNADADAAIDVIVAFAKQNLVDERFIIVEHILLRPENINDALLEVCVDADCKFCGDEDPYSYRVTFVFDGESDLALNHLDFRHFAEMTIRAELPAHVMCKICWVKSTVYQSFEVAYVNWLNDLYVPPEPPPDPLLPDPLYDCKTRAGVTANALKNVICEFGQLKSIYPPATLHDCIDGNDNNRVFLNRTSL